MKLNLFFACLLLACIPAMAQQLPCGFDGAANALRSNPVFKEQEEKINHLLYEEALQFTNQNKQPGVPLEIPVAVHIVHQNGAENISDSLVTAAITELNLRFQNAAPWYDSTGIDVQIQFCLASVDPNGNPTTGITRNVSVNTDIIWTTGPLNDVALKNTVRWDPHLYLNIWVIRNIQSMYGYVGYAYYPASMGTLYDGVVLQYNYMNSNLLAHEVGHYLGLYHTFEGGCTNTNCLLNGDGVCDTPPDATNDFICPNNSCSTEMNDTSGFNPFITDINELPNYMDYTYCPLSFSTGQSMRMNDALTQIRSTLLQSNGCGQHPGGSIPVASFTSANSCNGTAFTNTSLNSVGAQWDFDSDGLIDDCGNVVTHQFPAIGNYTVTMYAAGYGGSDSVTQIISAQPYPYQNYPLINGFSGLGISFMTNSLALCQGSTATFYGEPGMVSYLWFNGDTTQNCYITNPATGFNVSLTAVDSAGLTWSTCYPVHVEPVPATIPPVITIAGNDTSFCFGDTLTLLFSYSPLFYTSTLVQSPGPIVPFWTNTSYTVTLPLNSTYYVTQTDSNGCMSNSNTLIIVADYVVSPFTIIQNNNILYAPAGIHYQWYLNGVPINNSDSTFYVAQQTGCYNVYAWWINPDCGTFSSDTVCITITDIHSEKQPPDVMISPNPFSENLNVTSGKSELVELILFDMASRRVLQSVVTASSTIHTGNLAKGMYMYEVRNKSGVLKKGKVVKQ